MVTFKVIFNENFKQLETRKLFTTEYENGVIIVVHCSTLYYGGNKPGSNPGHGIELKTTGTITLENGAMFE